MSARPRPSVPEPRLGMVKNLTPFSLFQYDKMSAGRRFHDVVVVKGTFVLAPGTLKVAAAQAPVELADDYWDLDAPERSSLRVAGDAVLVKPSTDVLVTGTARSPEGRALTAWDAAVVVKDGSRTVLDYTVQVTGPRRFQYRSAWGWTLTDPEPTTQVPIRYELAYGGAYPDRRDQTGERWIVHEPNPSGTGFFDEAAMNPAVAYPAPQWQPQRQPVTGINKELPLTGFGPISRPWSARLRYVGTCDEAWERAQRADVARGLPADYPPDFDPRFFQCAHPSLVTREHLKGDEHLGLAGLWPERQPLVMKLPGLPVQARLLDGRVKWHDERMPLDTVHVDLDAGRVHLCWRLTLDQDRDIRAAAIHTRVST